MRVGVECGQRWWRWRSWTYRPRFCRLQGVRGYAVGPIMIFLGKEVDRGC